MPLRSGNDGAGDGDADEDGSGGSGATRARREQQAIERRTKREADEAELTEVGFYRACSSWDVVGVVDSFFDVLAPLLPTPCMQKRRAAAAKEEFAYVEMREKLPFDSQSIISTYSTHENHPGVIRAPVKVCVCVCVCVCVRVFFLKKNCVIVDRLLPMI